MAPPAETMISPESRVTIAPDVVFNDVDGETVLLSGAHGRYYGLDRVGTRIWELLREGPQLSAVHSRLTQEFDAPADRLWTDLAALVGELQQKGLIEVHGPDAS